MKENQTSYNSDFHNSPKDSDRELDNPGEKFSFETIIVNASGQITQRETKSNRQQIFDLGNGIKLEMVYIPGGTFMMGAPENENRSQKNEKPQHQVTIKTFWMAKYPITQAQYKAITGENPAHFEGDENPVECVSHFNAVDFCTQLSAKLGKEFKLPSEAQWEYACRAGTTTPFYFGETITGNIANYNTSNTYGDETREQDAYRQQTTPVGNFPPNAFGLYDMHGNVWEWCADKWHRSYDGAPTDGSAWISGDSNMNVLRGGSWSNFPSNCRSAFSGRRAPQEVHFNYGFRCITSEA